MLLFTTATGRELDARQPPRCSFDPASLVKFQRQLPQVVRHHSVNYFWAHLSYKEPSPVVGGRALRARSAAPRPRNPFHFDTRHNRFGVLSPASVGGLSAPCFLCDPREQAPVNQPHHALHPARSRRGCLIAKVTHSGNHLVKPRRFHHQPVFSCVPAAASVSTRIHTRYQTDNRCRQRHRVRKAVFTQLVGVGPKALRHVVRSGQ